MQSKQELSRRNLLKGLGLGALGLGAISLPTISTSAQTSSTGEEVAAYYRFTLGDSEMIAILDASFSLPLNVFGADQSEDDVRAVLEGFRVPVSDGGTAPANVINLVKIDGDSVILFDTGNGAGGGKLASTLDAIGVGTENVTNIVVSHFHPDHVNGISADGVLTYPNAQIHFPQAEYDFIQGAPENVVGNVVNRLQPALDADQVVFYENDSEIAPGIMSVPTPGHSPGHQAFRISNGDNQLIHFVDSVFSVYVSFGNPDWALGFDADPAMAAESRRMVLDMAAADGVPIFGYHFSFPGLGYALADGDAFRFVPLAF